MKKNEVAYRYEGQIVWIGEGSPAKTVFRTGEASSLSEVVENIEYLKKAFEAANKAFGKKITIVETAVETTTIVNGSVVNVSTDFMPESPTDKPADLNVSRTYSAMIWFKVCGVINVMPTSKETSMEALEEVIRKWRKEKGEPAYVDYVTSTFVGGYCVHTETKRDNRSLEGRA